MKTGYENPERILHTIRLTNRLMEDIRARGLQPGASYYTTREASRFLNVAGGFANRALQLLEKRQIIKRSQRVGSVIQNVPGCSDKEISRVTFCVYERYFRKEGVGSGEILAGLQGELPQSIVEFGLLAPDHEIEYITRMVDRALKSNEIDAFVLFSASFEVQQIIAKSGLPAVICGTPYPSIRELSFVEQDREDTHHQVIRHLRSHKRKHPVYLFRDTIHPGEKRSLKTIRRYPEFTKEVPLLFSTSNEEEIAAEIDEVYDSGYKPDAFVCNSIVQAEVVEEVMFQRGLDPYRDADIIVTSYFLQRGAHAKFTHIEKCLTAEDYGRCLGHLLREKLNGGPVENVISPVRLVVCQRDKR